VGTLTTAMAPICISLSVAFLRIGNPNQIAALQHWCAGNVRSQSWKMRVPFLFRNRGSGMDLMGQRALSSAVTGPQTISNMWYEHGHTC